MNAINTERINLTYLAISYKHTVNHSSVHLTQMNKSAMNATDIS